MAEQAIKLTSDDYKSGVKPIWCPGCGDYAVYNAVLNALAELKVPFHKIAIGSGIGCSGRFPAFVKSYGFHGVHGRALPLATGMKMANPELTVLAIGGDGDGFSIGGGHLAHAARRNVDLTYIIMDNEIYGLTKGQPSPTSPQGMVRKASPYGTLEQPLNPLAMILAANASFVARGFSGRPKDLAVLVKRGMEHKGFSFIQVISPCVSWYNTYKKFRAIAKMLPEDHDTSDMGAAMKYAQDTETLWLGVFFERKALAYHELEANLQKQVHQDGYGVKSVVDRFLR